MTLKAGVAVGIETRVRGSWQPYKNMGLGYKLRRPAHQPSASQRTDYPDLPDPPLRSLRAGGTEDRILLLEGIECDSPLGSSETNFTHFSRYT